MRYTWDPAWRAKLSAHDVAKVATKTRGHIETDGQMPWASKQEALRDVEAFERGDPCPEFTGGHVHGKPVLSRLHIYEEKK